MYITISPQKLGDSYSTSVADFVEYLEKENKELHSDHQELFFSQDLELISPKEVVREIDANTAKLKTTEPRYYSLTINPSQRELKHIGNDPEKLKNYVRTLMKDYASCFNREINGRPIQASDILYFGKLEYARTYKGTDREIHENAPYSNRIAKLRNEIRKVDRGELIGSIKALEKEILQLQKEAPHKLDGKMIEQGMQKPGSQTHVHLIVSRKDRSNSVSLSPGSKYKASEVKLQGRIVKRGFDRDRFFQKAEERFDKQFGYRRNYVEAYTSRKNLQHNPKLYYSKLLQLPVSERKLAMQLIKLPAQTLPPIPNAQIRLAIKQLKKALEIGMRSGSIGY
ncbi:mobilization protein [Christiangramia fulva]|uniref:Mobilization protein n=1 Tax=Christiangramia fulva TaxID=2126553 RepID=A0A2R3ZAA2_9FLAO|nr:MobB family relaxase [Christiangramia fulva]AVR47180.1 mobilization protein [Christiangramia fulva]